MIKPYLLPRRKYVTVNSFGALGDGLTDDSASIQNAINSSNQTILFQSGYTYAINSTINVSENKTIIIEEGARVVPKDVNFANGNNYQILDKDRKMVFWVKGDNVTFDCKGVIDGLQETLYPFFMVGVFAEGQNNITVSELHVEKVHNGVMAIESQNSTFNNISYTNAPIEINYKNACLDLSYSKNITGENFYGEGAEEVVDLNPGNDTVNLSNIEGVNVTESIFEVNSSINIVINNISGTTNTEIVRVQNYTLGHIWTPVEKGREVLINNTNITITNIEGFLDIVEPGEVLTDIYVP